MIRLRVMKTQTIARNANMKANGASIENLEMMLNKLKELQLHRKYSYLILYS